MADGSGTGGQGVSRPRMAWIFLAVLVVAVPVGIWLAVAKANVRPDREACPNLRRSDDLVHLAGRPTGHEARAQLDRWAVCDGTRTGASHRRLASEAEATLGYDVGLIAALTVTVFTAGLVMRRQRRWRLAALTAMVLAVAYAAADLSEDLHLSRFLKRPGDWSTLLPISSALKVGTLVAALPVVGAAVFVVLFGEPRNDIAGDSTPRPSRHFISQWVDRMKSYGVEPVPVGVDPSPADAPEDADHEEERGGLGICCSGGGIRSAAFSLGALQALEEHPSAELSRARWLFSVSGGSYMAGAWATARAAHPASEPPRPWARQSFEEQYLRRHASYLAPGLAGKAWALVWFLLAFIANAGLVALTIGALFLPAGWLIHTGVRPRPVDHGTVTLPAGGCLELKDGSFLTVVSGTSLELTGGSRVVAAKGAVVEPVKDTGKGKATATVEGAPPFSAVAIAGQPATTTTTVPSPVATVTCPAVTQSTAEAGALASDAPGRVFEKGTKVPIQPGPDVGVRTSSRRATGCLAASCTEAVGGQYAIRRGARLLGAPTVQLTLGTDAVVRSDAVPRLDQACGQRRCVRFELRPALTTLLRLSLVLLVLAGLALVTMREDPQARRRLADWTKRLTLAVGALVVGMWLFPELVLFLGRTRDWLEHFAGVATGASGGTILVALITQLWASSAKTDTPTGKVQGALKALGGRLRPLLVRLAAVVAGPVLLLVTAVIFASYGASPDRQYTQIAAGLVMIGWLVIFGSCGDLNRWSLHPYYRDRLRSGFAVDRTTGEVRDEPLAALGGAANAPPVTLCATANLADARITSPGRPALPWTFSSDEMGSCPGTGCYAPTALPARFNYLGRVWTSVAVSGAAFSPAMGKMGRPERVLFALGNLRLGLWYPNPLYFQGGDEANGHFDPLWYEWHHPRLWYLFKEAFGLHRLRDPWVYVTDGGHYENLGLVELLRTKECTEVYCFDAAGDSTRTFGTFADAMRLAREEHQIEIDLDPRAMSSDADGVSKVGIWAGTVRYPSGTTGWLIVAKLAVPLSAPFDIVDLARTLPSFPTHPTADQLYTDQKFEAYRALGEHLGREAATAGALIRARVAGGMSPQAAVDMLDRDLCLRRDPHPCPPPKPS